MKKQHWSAYIDYDHDGNDDWHDSACGVGRGNREGEEWESSRVVSGVTCKNCLKWLARNKGESK